MKLEKLKPTTKGEHISADYYEIMAIRRQVLFEASRVVRGHWNDSTTMVNQKQQASLSAECLERMANESKQTAEAIKRVKKLAKLGFTIKGPH